MDPLEMMFRSGVMVECRPVSRRQERAQIRDALKDIMPQENIWPSAIASLIIVIVVSVMFVRWWLCA